MFYRIKETNLLSEDKKWLFRMNKKFGIPEDKIEELWQEAKQAVKKAYFKNKVNAFKRI